MRGQRWNSKPIMNDQMTTQGFIWLIRQTMLAMQPMLVDGASLLSFIDWRQWPNLVGAIETCDMRVNNMVVWDKMSMGLGNGFRAQHELVLHASVGTHEPEDKGTGNVLKCPPDIEFATVPAAIVDMMLQLHPETVAAALAAAGVQLSSEQVGLLRTAHQVAKRAAMYDDCGTVIECARDSNDFHPSPKPVSIMAKLVRVVTAPGDLVVDPFAGAGATGVACKQEGRRCILVEGKEAHCRTAKERLAQGVLL